MKMNSKLRRILLTVCSAALLVCVTVGATVAYLTSEKTVTNTFTVGKVAITLDEADVKPDGTYETNQDARVTANEYHLMPGHTYTKDPTITVEAKSEEAYVRALITVNNRADLDELFKTYKLDITEIVTGIGTNWDIDHATNSVDGDNRIYEIRYKDTVKKSDTATKLDPLFTSIVVPNVLTNDDIAKISDLEIKVVAQAIQADGFTTADAAWKAFDGE